MSPAPVIPAGRRANVLFHGVGRPTRTMDDGEDRFWISRDEFLRLADDFTTWDRLALSVDDGNVSDVEIVLPALRERGLTATFFIIADRIGRPGSLDGPAIRELVDAGMTIGCHGWTHTPWTRFHGTDLDREVVDARYAISDITGTPVTLAALPLGAYNRAVLRAARDAGYTALFTSDQHLAHVDSWRQPRFTVHAGTTPESLAGRVSAARRPTRRAYATLNQLRKAWL